MSGCHKGQIQPCVPAPSSSRDTPAAEGCAGPPVPQNGVGDTRGQPCSPPSPSPPSPPLPEASVEPECKAVNAELASQVAREQIRPRSFFIPNYCDIPPLLPHCPFGGDGGSCQHLPSRQSPPGAFHPCPASIIFDSFTDSKMCK